MHALAEQLKETFTKSGMTPEDLFNTFEKDGDGEIGKEEFKRMLMSLGANIQMKQIEDLFTLLESDGGGEVDVVRRTRNLCRLEKGCIEWLADIDLLGIRSTSSHGGLRTSFRPLASAGQGWAR